MKIAIYSRKSKWTGKGESIENQLIMCREYIMATISGVTESDIFEYEDEGFSGKNTHRPQFQNMLNDIHKEHFDFLVCYKLDRLGRNLADIANLIEELNRLDITFISIKEKFDTSTPIGKAMMYFSGVLAQMEREQIAERVRDNMLMLARSGRWLGGNTPLGFTSKKEEKISINDKVRTSHRLEVNEEEMKTVQFIYSMFLKERSLSKLVKYFMENDIKTRNDKDYQIMSFRDLLTNPVYCTIDKVSYDYFMNLGCHVCIEESEIDGKHGCIAYGKTSSGKYKNQQNPPTEWIVSVSKHKGIITGEEWVEVQQILEKNKVYSGNFRKSHNTISILSGILKCSCGYPMRPKYYQAHRTTTEGNRCFAYLCSCKEKTRGKKCNMLNINGNELDDLVCNEVIRYLYPNSEINKVLITLKKQIQSGLEQNVSEEEMLQESLKKKKEKMQKLIFSINIENASDTVMDYINQQMESLNYECIQLENRILQVRKETSKNQDINRINGLLEEHSDFEQYFKNLSVNKKREYLNIVLDQVVWDGNRIHVYIYGNNYS